MTLTTSNDRRLTPQERLASSRSAIVKYMAQGGSASGQDRKDSGAHNSDTNFAPGSIWHTFKRAVRIWWQHHPAQIAIDLARPVLGTYAREKPLQLLGLAAGAGAAAVLVRPWRLVSMTGLLFTTIKSTQFSKLLLSLLSAKSESASATKDMP